MADIAGAFVAISPDLKGFGTKLKSALAVALKGTAAGVGGAGAVAGAAYATAFVAQAAQAVQVAGVAPAAGVAAAQAIGTIKLAFSGLSDVLKLAGTDQKKYNEELAKLPPQQQAVVKQLAALKPAFDQVKAASFNIFPGVQSAITDLSGNIPTVIDGVEQMALALSDVAEVAGKEFSGPVFRADLATLLNTNANSVHNFALAGVDLGKSLFDVAVAGAPVLETISEMAQQAGEAAKSWVELKLRNGDLTKSISSGLREVQLLGGTLYNIGVGIHNTFSVAGQSTNDLVLGLNHLTDKFRAFSETDEYQNKVQSFFNAIQTGTSVAGSALGPVIELLKYFKSELNINIESTFGSWPALFERIKFSTGPLQETFRGLLAVIASLVPIVIQLITTGVGPLGLALKILGPILQQVANFFTNFPALSGAMVTALLVVVAGIKAFVLYTRLVAAMTAAWEALNLAFAANPFVLIAIGIAAFVAGLIYAYKNSETFRNIVNAVFNAVKVAVLAVVDALVVAFHALVDAWNWSKDAAMAVANFFVAAWNGAVNGLKAAWDGIVTGFNTVKTVITTVIGFVVDFVKTHMNLMLILFLGPVGLIIALINNFRDQIAAAFVAMWNLIKPVLDTMWSVITAAFNLGKTVIEAVWNALWTAIKTVFELYRTIIVTYIQTLWTVITTAFNLGKAAVEAVWNLLWTVIKTAAETGKNLVMTVINAFTGAITAAFTAVKNATEPIWSGLWNAIKTTVDTIKTVVTTAINGFLNGVKTAFEAAKNGIKATWDQVEGIAKAPIKFVIDTVFNNGLRKAWNAVAGFLNLPLKIGEIPTLATGGMPGQRVKGKIRGPGTETSDDILALLSNNEYVVNAASTRRWLPLLEFINGEGRNADPRSLAGVGNYGFALGGLIGKGLDLGKSAWNATGGKAVGAVTSTFSTIAGAVIDFAREGAAKGFELAMAPVKALINSTLGTSDDSFKGNIGSMGMDLIATVANMVRGAEDAQKASSAPIPGLGGTAQWRNVIIAALNKTGHTADEGAIQTVMRRMAQESGGNAAAINNWDVNAANGTPSKGLMQVIQPTFNAYRDKSLSADIYDPLANIVAAIRYADSRYGSYVTGFNRAGGYRFGGLVRKFDTGGMLMPGVTQATNNTGKPEWVLTQAQLAKLLTGGASGEHYFDVHVKIGDRELTDIVDVQVEKKDKKDGDQIRYGRKGV